MAAEQVLISRGRYNFIFTEAFAEQYNSIFKQNQFTGVHANNLYNLLESNELHPFFYLETMGRFQIKLTVNDFYCRICLEKAFWEGSLLPKNVVFFKNISRADIISSRGECRLDKKRKFPRPSIEKIIEKEYGIFI